MRPTKVLNLSALLAVSLLLGSFVFGQNSKQELNDQLFDAARKGDAAAVTALLDKGVDVNTRFRYGMTALFKAAERGNTEVVKVLLARGVDVNVKDTFYGQTAMDLALNNKHTGVIRALLEKKPEYAGDVLLTGARSGDLELVRAAVDRGGLTPVDLTSALASATAGESKNDEIAALLKKAGAVPPPEVDAATLQSYVGHYKAEPGPEFFITVADGKLFIAVTGQGKIPLLALDTTTFKPATFDGVTVTFKVEAGKTTGLAMKQGTNTTQLKRIEDVKP